MGGVRVMPVQFPYPERPWSQGTMRKARYQPLPDEPTPGESRAAVGSLDYDVLKQEIGEQGAAWIKRFDQKASSSGADPDLVKNWQQWRKHWINMFKEFQGESLTGPPETKKGLPTGPMHPWEVQT